MTCKPRIAIVVPNLMIGGTERHLLAVLPRLVSRGFTIEIVTTRGAGTLDNAFTAHRINLHHPGRLARLGMPGIVIGLILTLLRLRPDIVHFFLPEAYLLGAPAALIAGVPRRVMSRRSQNRYQRKYPLYAALERWCHKRMHAVIGNSPVVCAELAAEGVPAHTLGLIVNGLDIEYFVPGDRSAARAELGLLDQGPVMAIVANLNVYKGHDDLIKALATIRDRLPANWTLLCIGRDVGLGDMLRTHAETAGIATHIRWLGEQTDVLLWLQASDFALLCSHEEGSPNSLIEAMAVGLPVIATNVGGVPDIVIDGQSGYIVPAHAPDRLAERILDLATNDTRRHDMSRVARAQIEDHFALDRCVGSYAVLYDRLYEDAEVPVEAPTHKVIAAAPRGARFMALVGARLRRWKIPRLAFQATVSFSLLAAVIAVVIDRASAPQLAATIDRLPAGTVLLAVAALAAGALLAAVRVRMVAGDLGYSLSWRDSLATLALGQLGGALFFQIAGQLAARGAYLARRGLPVSASVLMVGYERLLSMVVSLILAAIGAWHIFGYVALDVESGGDELVKLAIGALLAVSAGAWFGWGRLATSQGSALIGRNPLRRIARATLLSLAIQAMTASAYIVLAHQLAPAISVLNLSAATVVVMFAAALPISLAGWGVRELSAVVALGAVGVPAGAAVVTAAIVGVGSLLVVVPLGAAAISSRSAPASPKMAIAPKLDYTRLTTLFIPLAVATGVFFHVHLPTEAGGLNVNLADPLALLGGALFLIIVVWQRRLLPQWRLSEINLHIFFATTVISAALLIGAARFGWTDWALTNKYLGWYALLVYAATGALIAATANTSGVYLLLKTFAAAGLAVAGLEMFLEALRTAGVELSERVLWWDASGFAANRNAFAFQMLMVTAAFLSVDWPARAKTLALGLVMTALWFAGSRGGWISVSVLILVAIAVEALSWRQAAYALVFGTCLTLTIEFAWLFEIMLGADIDQVVARVGQQTPLNLISPSSLAERLKSYAGAWHLFSENPLFGAGLGAHIEGELRATGIPLVIHSTPLWIAAEMGLLGLIVFATPILRILRVEIGRARSDPAARLLVLAITAFGTMSLVHEMLYQRTFWLLIGAGLAWLSATQIPGRKRDRP